MGHDVTHEMDLAPLPGATGKRLTDGFRQSFMSIRYHQPYIPGASGLEMIKQRLVGGFRLFRHGLDGQDIPPALFIDADHHLDGHIHNAMVVSDFLVEGIHPQDWIGFL